MYAGVLLQYFRIIYKSSLNIYNQKKKNEKLRKKKRKKRNRK